MEKVYTTTWYKSIYRSINGVQMEETKHCLKYSQDLKLVQEEEI